MKTIKAKSGKNATIKKSIFKKLFAVKFEIKEKGKKIAWGFLYLIYAERHKEPYALLENIYVEKEHRSRGFGSALIKEIIKEAKKYRCYKIIGTSKFTNVSAHGFYERLGFKKIGYEFRMDLRKSKIIQRD
jgi:GNAT superfamily N-acetyltransferase